MLINKQLHHTKPMFDWVMVDMDMVNVIATSLDFEPSYLLIAPPPLVFPLY